VNRPILESTERAALIAAIEENANDFLRGLGGAGGGEERVDAKVAWTIGGSTVDNHNAIYKADVAPEDVNTVIAAAVERLRARKVSGTWHVGPSTRQADIGARLIEHGFTFGADEPGMAADLSALVDHPAPTGFTVSRVRNEHDLAEWIVTLASGFGEGPHEANWAGAMYRKIGFGDDAPSRLYVGRIDGKPVATASCWFAAGVAGVYFVYTVESMRRRGIGAAITVEALKDARSLGYRIGVLGSSPMGQSVYARIGFREYCSIAIYEWRLPAPPA
jgi:predicted GNAT family acetyltransferase